MRPQSLPIPVPMATETTIGVDNRRLQRRIAVAAWICIGIVLAPRLPEGVVAEYVMPFVYFAAILLGVVGGLVGTVLSLARKDFLAAIGCAVPPALIVAWIIYAAGTADWQ